MTESLFSVNEQDGIDPVKIRDIAASYYRCGDFYCSEAVVKAIKDAFDLQVPDSVVAMASGFPIGIGGAGCTLRCGEWRHHGFGTVFRKNQTERRQCKQSDGTCT
jgi:hypothetical protein